MDTQEILALLSRWAHIIPAIILVGGALFMRYCLGPALIEQGDAGEAIRESVRRRWAKLVMVTTLLLLVSGLYNAYVKAVGFHLDGIYLGLLTVKILLALVVFFFAALLAGKSEKAKGMREKEMAWLHILCIAMLVLVLIAGHLKMGEYEPKIKQEQQEQNAANELSSDSVTATCYPNATGYRNVWGTAEQDDMIADRRQDIG